MKALFQFLLPRRPALALCFLTLPAHAATVTLTSIADAEMRQFSPDANFGSSVSMASGKIGSNGNGEIRRALFQFDLTGQVPQGATITAVSLSVRVVNFPLTPINSNFDVHRLMHAWDEGTATWNSASSGVAWDSPGAEGLGDFVSSASSSVFVSSFGTYDFPGSTALLADVQAWANDPASNFGWLLVSEDETDLRTARRFGTRESAVNAPTLTIDYFVGVTIQTQPQSQTVFAGRNATFTVSATGTGTLTYQWQFNGNPIPGATNSVLILTNVQPPDEGPYTVVVSDPNGSTTSQPAILTVSLLPLPEVTILPPPTNGEKFPAHTDLAVTADAAETNGTITQLEMLLDTNLLATTTNTSLTVQLTDLQPGEHVLSAVATDALGTVGSNQVSFLVLSPPAVSITHPTPASTFPFGTNITISVASTNSGATNIATITNALVFANGILVGQHPGVPSSFSWNPAQAGPYSLTAVAIDELSESITSAPVAIRVFTPETVPPKLHITKSPANFARLTNPQITVQGTASDDVGVDHIAYQLNTNLPQAAIGTTTWTATILLAPGPNTIRFWAVDLAGNTNLPATRFYTYVVKAPLTLQTSGGGSISPNLNGRMLELGKIFTVNAQPSRGSIFAGWGGATNLSTTVDTNLSKLTFQMSSNLNLAANFVPNPFPPLAGAYTGLFFDTNNVQPETSGMLSLQLASQGAFTGKLNMSGRNYPFHGRLDAAGETTRAVLRRSLKPAVLALNLAFTNGQIFGYVTNVAGSSLVVSTLLADRNVFKQPGNPAKQAGSYSLKFNTIPAGPNPAASASVFIGLGGPATIRGVSQDGQHFVTRSTLAADGTLPLYISLNNGAAVILGTIDFPIGGSPTGALIWVQTGSNSFSRRLTVSP